MFDVVVVWVAEKRLAPHSTYVYNSLNLIYVAKDAIFGDPQLPDRWIGLKGRNQSVQRLQPTRGAGGTRRQVRSVNKRNAPRPHPYNPAIGCAAAGQYGIVSCRTWAQERRLGRLAISQWHIHNLLLCELYLLCKILSLRSAIQ